MPRLQNIAGGYYWTSMKEDVQKAYAKAAKLGLLPCKSRWFGALKKRGVYYEEFRIIHYEEFRIIHGPVRQLVPAAAMDCINAWRASRGRLDGGPYPDFGKLSKDTMLDIAADAAKATWRKT